MPRPAGSRNADYEETRARLLAAVRARLLAPGGARASFRELAAAAGVSPATLRHYFKDREAVVAATLEALHAEGLPFIAEAAMSPRGPVADSLAWFLRSIVFAWRRAGVGAAHGLGLTAGIGDPALGAAYVNELLEPTLQAGEARLGLHVASGELRATDLRHAALALLSPVVLGLLHQDDLAGAKCRALDLDAFLADHLRHFLAAYGRPAPHDLTQDLTHGPPAARSLDAST